MTSRSGRILNTIGKSKPSASFRGKSSHSTSTPVKFDFRITLNEITKIKDAAKSVVVVWERRDKLEATNPVKVSFNRASVKQTLTVSVTLYKPLDPKQSVTGYEPKMAKLAVRLKAGNGKTVGKIHVDMGEFARVPSGVVSKDFSLSNGSILTTKIESRLSASGKSRRGRANSTAGSVRSEMTTGSGGLSGQDDDASSIDSLNSLMDEIDQDETTKPDISKRKALSRNASSQPSSPTTNSESKAKVGALRKDIEELEERGKKLETSIRDSEAEAGRLREEHEEIDRQIKSLSRSGGQKPVEDKSVQLDKLAQKIQAVEKSNMEMEEQNEQLEKDVEAQSNNVEKLSRYHSAYSSGDLEGAALRRELDELQAKIDHEPELAEVAQEFQDTKALLSLAESDKNETLNKLRNVYSKAGQTPGPGSVLAN